MEPMIGEEVPTVTFKTRVRDESIEGSNPYRWQDVTTDDLFKGKKVVLFSLPGACLLYTSPSPRDATLSRMPSSA